MGEILTYYWKIFEPSFLVKEGTNNKTLDVILFACSREVGKSYSRPKNTEVMSICLCHVKAIVCDRFFFMNSAFVCNEEG